jgi:hypothetical protein
MTMRCCPVGTAPISICGPKSATMLYSSFIDGATGAFWA